MKTKSVAWGLLTGAAVVTAVGALVPEPGLAVSSVVLGGTALATSLHVRFQITRQKISHRILEQMR